jgi:hypothetical protein
MCKKGVREELRECPTCRTDLGLLVDYLSDLDGSLDKAQEYTRAGELGKAVWAYLEVLEVDPDNPEAKRQVAQVVTAVRQFDEVMPGRRWVDRLRKQARFRKVKEDIVDVTPRGWAILAGTLVLLTVALFLGFFWGLQAATPASTTPAASSDKDGTTRPSGEPKDKTSRPFRPSSVMTNREPPPKGDEKKPPTLGGRP